MRFAKRRRRNGRVVRETAPTPSVRFASNRASLGVSDDDMVVAMGRAAPSLKALYKSG